MNGVETCPWFGTRQHCQKEKDPILSLLWEKPQVPLQFLCIWEAQLSYPFLQKPTFQPPVTSGGIWVPKNIEKTTFLRGQSWSASFWKLSNKKECSSKPARTLKFMIRAASTSLQNCKKMCKKKKKKSQSQILKPRVTWYSSYAVLHVPGSSIVRQKFTNLGLPLLSSHTNSVCFGL